MQDRLLHLVMAERDAGRPVAVVTALADGAQSILFDNPQKTPEGAVDLTPAVLAQLRSALAADHSAIVDSPIGRLFIHAFNPPLRLVIVGAVHIAQPLIPLARLLGFTPILVDPREAWASAARFPDVTIYREWPDDALRALSLDGRTAVVTLTHDPKLDDPALQIALPSPAFYVGALGSQRTHAKRIARLSTEEGVSIELLKRLHAPIGLPLGARAPAEIALSIMGEIVALRHARATAIAQGTAPPTLATNKQQDAKIL